MNLLAYCKKVHGFQRVARELLYNSEGRLIQDEGIVFATKANKIIILLPFPCAMRKFKVDIFENKLKVLKARKVS